MDIMDEANNIRKKMDVTVGTEAEIKQETEILQVQFAGLWKAYQKAKKAQHWKIAHDLLIQLVVIRHQVMKDYHQLKAEPLRYRYYNKFIELLD